MTAETQEAELAEPRWGLLSRLLQWLNQPEDPGHDIPWHDIA